MIVGIGGTRFRERIAAGHVVARLRVGRRVGNDRAIRVALRAPSALQLSVSLVGPPPSPNRCSRPAGL